jgi:hypothetical protein
VTTKRDDELCKRKELCVMVVSGRREERGIAKAKGKGRVGIKETSAVL